MSYVQEPGGDATNGEETLTQHSWFMGRKEKKSGYEIFTQGIIH